MASNTYLLDMQNKQRQKDKYELSLRQKMSSLIQMCITLGEKLKENVQNLNSLQTRVLDNELIRWKREQQLAGNGCTFNSNLDNIQEWCENLASLIW